MHASVPASYLVTDLHRLLPLEVNMQCEHRHSSVSQHQIRVYQLCGLELCIAIANRPKMVSEHRFGRRM